MGVKKIVLKIGKFVVNNEPAILTGTGVAFGLGGAVALVPATVKAKNAVDAYKADHKKEKVTFKKIVKIAGKYYILPASLLTAGTTCTIMGQHICLKRNAALTAALVSTGTALNEYKAKAAATLGDKAVQKVNDAITQDKVNENPVPENIVVPEGEVLFLEPATNQYFYSTWDKVKNAIATLNIDTSASSVGYGYISLTDLLNAFDLNTSKATDVIGWDLTRGHKISIMSQTAALSADGKPCCSWTYGYDPVDSI